MSQRPPPGAEAARAASPARPSAHGGASAPAAIVASAARPPSEGRGISAALVWAARLGDPGAPLDLVLGEESGICTSLIDLQEGRFGAALSVDLKPSSGQCLHFQGDARAIACSRRWRRVFIFLPCTHLANSGSQYFALKVELTLPWYGIALCVWAYSVVQADIVVMENSRGLLETWARSQQILQPYEHGLSEMGLAESKATPLWRRGVYHDVVPTDLLPPPYVRRPVGDGAARSRAHPGLVAALVTQYPASAALPHAPPDLALELARAADGYTRRFGANALPRDWAHPMVRPPEALLAQLEYPEGALAAPSSPESWRGLPDSVHFEVRASTALGLWRQCVGAQMSRGRRPAEGDWDVRRPDPCSNPFPIGGSADRALVPSWRGPGASTPAAPSPPARRARLSPGARRS